MPASTSRAKSKRSEYKIGEACKVLDIPPYVLRYWETEFPALNPHKSRSGQRVYGEKELQIIRRIQELLYSEGYTIAGAKKRLEVELASGQLESAAAPIEVATAGPEPGLAAAAAAREPQPDGQLDGQLDSQAAEKIQHLRQGVERALQQARSILHLLGSKAISVDRT